jgi:hypothetical protein
MNVEIGTEAAQFPEKEHINGIFVAVWDSNRQFISLYIFIILVDCMLFS